MNYTPPPKPTRPKPTGPIPPVGRLIMLIVLGLIMASQSANANWFTRLVGIQKSPDGIYIPPTAKK